MKTKSLLLIPSAISKITENGTLQGAFSINRITQSIITAEINISIPIVTDNIVHVNTHLSTTYEQKQLVNAAEMTSAGKNILIDIELDDMLNNCITGTELLEYIKVNNNMIYIASAKSLLTNSAIDIYYHKADKCLYVTPELSAVGNPPMPISGMNISMYRVAPLNIEASLNSSTMFSESTEYYKSLKFKDSVIDLSAGLAIAKTDVAVYTMLMQGLNTYAVSSEYSRNTNTGGTVNQLGKERPVHLIVLETPANELLDNNNINSCLIVQASPHDWKLRTAGKSMLSKIVFPIHI